MEGLGGWLVTEHNSSHYKHCTAISIKTLNAMQFITLTHIRQMAEPVCIARTLHYSLRGRWETVVHSGVRYELTHTLRLNNTDRVRDI